MVYNASGILHKVLLPKRVGKDGHRTVVDFIIVIENDKKFPQIRRFQAIDNAVSSVQEIRIGSRVLVEFSLCGREFDSKKRPGEKDYYNIDEVSLVRVL